MSGIILKEVDDSTIPTPSSGKITVFADSADSEPKFKDDTGTVHSFEGAPGQGVPPGGTAGQVLAKIDGTDYNTEWRDESAGSSAYTIVTEASAFTADPGTHDGVLRLILAGGDATFDSAEPYTAGMTFNLRATAAIELIEDGVTLTPPAGGTLELDAAMAVQVVMTGATTGIVIGQTVAA